MIHVKREELLSVWEEASVRMRKIDKIKDILRHPEGKTPGNRDGKGESERQPGKGISS